MGRDDVLARLKAHHEEIEGFGVESLRLFGSVAREEASADSDVDLLVKFRETPHLLRLHEAADLPRRPLGRPRRPHHRIRPPGEGPALRREGCDPCRVKPSCSWRTSRRAAPRSPVMPPAVRLLVERHRVIAEGAGATPVAAALAGVPEARQVVCVVSGGKPRHLEALRHPGRPGPLRPYINRS